ncbi:MAG: DUF4097 family beta strand repeat protein [Acidobacteria bacterium]|nr:DUF4097 family beta strand repeat protein [Acidobacteriota bacterium]
MLATRLATTLWLAGLTALPAQPASAQQVEERVDRTIPFQPGGTLRLKTFSGKVEIRGTSGSEMVIHAVRRATPDQLRNIRFDIQSADGTITINANENDGRKKNDNVVETDIEILVPMQTRLDVKSFSAPVTVRGVEGPSELDTFSGKVVVDAGTWPDGQDLDVNTFSGDIELRLPSGARGDFAFNTFSGDLTTDLPLTLSSARGRRDVRGALNGGGSGHVRLKTFSGDATLRE